MTHDERAAKLANVLCGWSFNMQCQALTAALRAAAAQARREALEEAANDAEYNWGLDGFAAALRAKAKEAGQ